MASPTSLDESPSCCPACGAQVPLPAVEPDGDLPCPACGHLVWFLHKKVGDVAMLTFLPGLIVGAESARRMGEVAAMGGQPPRIVVNLCHLRFVSSLFLGMLVSLHRRVSAAGGALRICGLSAQTAEALRVSRLDRVLAIHDDEAGALASIAQ